MLTEARIVASARSWLGTRFHHQGRLKKNGAHKGGVDCLGLLMGVADELNIRLANGMPMTSLDRTDYTHSPDTEALKKKLSETLYPIPVTGILAGNILLLFVDRSPQHLAIVTDYRDGLGIIHAYAPARAVVEHSMDDKWKSSIACAYSISSQP